MEEMEVPTEHLHEAIEEGVEEALEKQEKKSSMYIAISTALMAVLAALASLLAGHHSDEALIEQIKASDQWAYYQAKGIKAEIRSLAPAGPATDSAIAHYKHDQGESQKQAKEAEDASHEHLERHSVLARAVTMFQIAIAISAIAILTRRKPLWWISMGVSALGLVFFILGLL
ncbi:DUF4337 family protein [Dinghuibacter silviterrae]|uniref:Uncharacterized protein DUF4337 n=1 Tax=Dinghuibacter silviterrae TaxID=1539049 RepID=A0A4R8DV99_9BACT|nr:DUF4337 family protein [Dinghuibacter silviterrae]TDX01111.1 uncharacterized protein DUF4337 [Dinghuibacter silviterrae]